MPDLSQSDLPSDELVHTNNENLQILQRFNNIREAQRKKLLNLMRWFMFYTILLCFMTLLAGKIFLMFL